MLHSFKWRSGDGLLGYSMNISPSVRCSIYFSDCLSICVSFWTLMDPPSWRMSVEKCLISFWRQWIVSSLVFLLCLRVSFYSFFCSHEDSCSCVCDFESIYWPSFSSAKNEGKFFSFLCLPNPNYRYKSLLETKRERERTTEKEAATKKDKECRATTMKLLTTHIMLCC